MNVRNIVSELKSPLKSPFRRRLFFKYMVLANVITLGFIVVYLLNVNAIPVFVSFNKEKIESIDWFEGGGSKINQVKVLVEKSKPLFEGVAYSSGSFYDKENNVLGTIELDHLNRFQRQPYVANGYIGSRIPNLGQGFAYDGILKDGSIHDITNGWPLFNRRYSGAFAAGFYNTQERVNLTNFPELYEKGYDSVIAAIPQWTTLTLSTERDNIEYVLDPSLSSSKHGSINNYIQSLSLSTGIVTTEFTWLDTIHVRYQVLAHKHDINLGIINLQLTNLGESSVRIKVEDKLDFSTSQRAQLVETDYDKGGIYMVFLPKNVDYVNGVIYSRLDLSGKITRRKTENDVLQFTDLTIKPKETKHVTKYAGVVTSDLDETKLTTKIEVLDYSRKIAEKYSDFKHALETHKKSWSSVFTTHITFQNNDLLTMVSKASMYHLLANSRENAEGLTAALSVGGLSSDSYGGMVFWDTDLWIFNALLPISPASALSIVNYRHYTHDQAIQNLQSKYSGAVYPWTSGRFGNCTSTGPCFDYEYHINTAVAMAAWNVYLSGSVNYNYTREVIYPLIQDAASFFADLVVYDESLNSYVIYNMTDPDEYANHVNNGAYTNAGVSALMKWCIALSTDLELPIDPRFENIAGHMHLPISTGDQSVTLEYSDMPPFINVKQADVVMITYPMDNELIDVDLAFRNLQFYANKQSPYGPAMTFPIYSIVSAMLSSSGCAYESYLRKSISPYLRGPFAQFSEQNNDEYNINGGTHPAFPFVTANGGFLQAIIQGITGLRYGFKVVENEVIKCLHLDPVYSSSIDSDILFENIHYMNRTLTLRIHDYKLYLRTEKYTSIHHGDDFINIDIATRNQKAGLHKLLDNEELIIPLYVPSQSFEGSLTECSLANFIPLSRGKFGDLGSLMNDGDNSTHWQALESELDTRILIDFKDFRKVKGGMIVWGDKPPTFLKVYSLEVVPFIDFDISNSDWTLLGLNINNLLLDNSQYSNEFNLLVNKSVSISEPFHFKDGSLIELLTRSNTTKFEFDKEIKTRYALIEFTGTHDQDLTDFSGAKVFEVILY